MQKKEIIKEVVTDVAESSLEAGASFVIDNLPELGTEVAKIIENEALSTAVQALTGGVWAATSR